MTNFQIQRKVREQQRTVTVRSTAAKKQDETQKVHGQEDEVNSTRRTNGETSMMRSLGVGIAIALSITRLADGGGSAKI